MSNEERIERAEGLMAIYAERTGIRAEGSGSRYLWTDAFAVCNYLGLAQLNERRAEHHRSTALRLIERVHDVLGRYGEDDPRHGRLGRATDEHPTRGGLRIGKPLPERRPDQRFDSQLEWDRDGQYFHYLTKWMHALDQTARHTRRPTFNRWGRELAEAAYEGFTYQGPGGVLRMHWKMSIDLSRPLVPSMGQHDPLDGYVTAAQLHQTATELGDHGGPRLSEEMSSYGAMIHGGGLATDDPLGLGGLLMDASRIEQLMRRSFTDARALLVALLEGAGAGLAYYVERFDPDERATRRLAFRELGLSIGLHAAERMIAAAERGDFGGDDAARDALMGLERYLPLAGAIERFWLRPEHRAQRTWSEHPDINDVMLATSLVPEGFLVLPAVD